MKTTNIIFVATAIIIVVLAISDYFWWNQIVFKKSNKKNNKKDNTENQNKFFLTEADKCPPGFVKEPIYTAVGSGFVATTGNMYICKPDSKNKK